MAGGKLILVVDTNVLLVSISDRSAFHWLYRGIIDGQFDIAVTTDILDEYAEIIGQKWHPDVADDVCRTLLELPNVLQIEPAFRMNLIPDDPDDNKFADWAFATNAHYLISNDRHYSALKTRDFPRIEVLTIQQFSDLIAT